MRTNRPAALLVRARTAWVVKALAAKIRRVKGAEPKWTTDDASSWTVEDETGGPSPPAGWAGTDKPFTGCGILRYWRQRTSIAASSTRNVRGLICWDEPKRSVWCSFEATVHQRYTVHTNLILPRGKRRTRRPGCIRSEAMVFNGNLLMGYSIIQSEYLVNKLLGRMSEEKTKSFEVE